ncbi:MAG: hypothetical protein HOC91_03880 [Nitrospinaceae bacterium]|jgi:hypothetical protein|nr:hypothetical protein [Nitrospinaceae bacterium]MBT3433831.1 hypothetical protein [Nitrospinaceae bacterium]MBT3821972.1 hypothetical protein [Nitrospinaceae bacterium]MBT4093267.1 hypothetical protein [Nitrospinaceae bacterium]MBT4429633.1 hypothetical protein [Nitrospinaceae bacterium]
METEKSVAPRNGLSAREKGFLSSLARKYETSDDAGQVRSYIIAAAGTLALFAIARWLPWWWAALIAFEAAALFLFYKYKRFSVFKTRVLVKLWRERNEES